MSTDLRLKILKLYHDCGPGGAEQMILDLCHWLRTQGHSVTVATCREGWLAQHLRESRIETHVVPKWPRFDPRMGSRIIRLARERGVDILHAHEFPLMVRLAPAALLNRLPLVATVHGREIIAARRRRRLAVGLAGRLCRRVVAVSQAMQGFLVQDLRIPKMKVQTIYNGIDIKRYSHNTPDQQLRQTLGIPGSARVIGTVGSLYPVKGQTYLLQAMAQVVRRFPETVCLIAGRGELLPVLQHEAADLKLGDRVKFLGYRSDVPALLDLMEIFVLPSLSEGLPLALLEAQAAGKPVVASNVGGNPEVVEDGKTGFLVPPSNPDVLTARLLQLLENPSQAVAMGEHGRLRVRRTFSLEAMGKAYLSLYMNCINGKAAHQAT